MNEPISLSLEQQFSIRSFEEQVKDASREQAQQLAIETYRMMLIQKAYYLEELAKAWGIKR